MNARQPRKLTIGKRTYDVFLPNPRDARLHVAMVVMTIHVLGQTVLHFRVSAVQILAAIGTCFIIELAVVFRRTKQFVWPASAMLTGSGVGLIMRIPTMRSGTPLEAKYWWMYSAVAAASLATKYVICYKGRHVFNPSNVGLVFVFLVFGSHWFEPLDFWWAKPNAWMLFAYALIIGGGTFVTYRVGLLPMAALFWGILGIGLVAIAVSGHQIYSPSSMHPVSGWHFWWLIITSPETLIFVYFMLSDPKTVPTTRNEKLVFGASVAVLACLLIAPQSTEFGTKVALLGALTICSALRLVWRVLPGFARTVLRSHPLRYAGTLAGVAFTALAVTMLTVLPPLTEVVDAAGLPATPPQFNVLSSTKRSTGIRSTKNLSTGNISTGKVAISTEAVAFSRSLTQRRADQIGTQLAAILQVERDALRRNHSEELASVLHGRRLRESKAALKEQSDQDVRVARGYTFSQLRLIVVPSQSEGANRLGIDAVGTMFETEFRSDGSAIDLNPRPFHHVFVLREATDRMLLVDELEQDRQVRVSLQ